MLLHTRDYLLTVASFSGTTLVASKFIRFFLGGEDLGFVEFRWESNIFLDFWQWRFLTAIDAQVEPQFGQRITLEILVSTQFAIYCQSLQWEFHSTRKASRNLFLRMPSGTNVFLWKSKKHGKTAVQFSKKKKNWCEVKRPLYSLAWWRRQVEKEIHQYETQRAKVILADFILSWTIGLSSE